jgi:hypothetical protein
VTLQNPPATNAPTSVNVLLLGQSIPVTLTDGVGTLPVVVHPSVAGANIRVQVNVPSSEQTTPAVPTVWTQLGSGNGPALGLQLGAPTASGDPYNVWPTSKTVLRAYYSGLLAGGSAALTAQTAQAQDLYTIVSVLAHATTKHVLPALTAASYSPVTLSADEQNALSDLQANVQPNMSQQLATIYPSGSGATRTEAYQGVVDRASTYDQALTAYAEAVAAIPNLTE